MPAMIMNGHCRSFNGDGRKDLLVRHDTNGELLVFPHSGKFDGTRTFLDPVTIGTDFSWEKHLIIRTIDIRGNGLASVLAGSENRSTPSIRTGCTSTRTRAASTA